MTDTRRCLAAFTAFEDMPPYFNVSQHENGDVEVTVRGPAVTAALGYRDCGPTTSIRMSAEQFQEALRAIVKDFRS